MIMYKLTIWFLYFPIFLPGLHGVLPTHWDLSAVQSGQYEVKLSIQSEEFQRVNSKFSETCATGGIRIVEVRYPLDDIITTLIIL